MSDDKVKIITEDIIYKSIITILGLAFIFLMSVMLYRTTRFTLSFYAIEIILLIMGANVYANFIGIFMDIKKSIKLKRNSEL